MVRKRYRFRIKKFIPRTGPPEWAVCKDDYPIVWAKNYIEAARWKHLLIKHIYKRNVA